MRIIKTLITVIGLAIWAYTPLAAEIIPNAAYAIVKKEGSWFNRFFENITRQSRLPYKTIFYTFDGNPITEVAGIIELHNIKQQLDPSAPKPQPVTFKIIRHTGAFITTPQHYIHFYDKNGNEIAWFIYDGTLPIKADELKKYEATRKKFIKQLDLSIVKDITSPWTDQLMWDLFTNQLLQ